ncbi:hypothetical protein NQ318_013467 [Aromia moschata]|uniref:Kinesin motor domain-containing protein n=1 Tax=Aromia moschata TaxID=1265417 RepID=A0AAV8YB06_9CUCU|nr:hypothetical protein NQ318_013467 [Aromia moschata]
MEDKSVDFVNVSLRIRPTLNQDRTSSCLQVISKQPPILLVLDRSQTYHLDKIFTEEVDQQTVYNETVKPLVECVKKGYNSTVFAYGQTGTGKTYTMGTSSHLESDEDLGLVPRTLDQFFESHLGDDNSEIDILISFIEIYNEKVFDLLQESNKSPLIVKGFKVHGFKQVNVFNCHEAKHLLKIGNKNRHTTGTKQNANSSRSHAIFTIYCNIKYRDRETCSKLNLVDLAGCESVRKTGNQGSTFQEGVNINKGLLCIGQVMTALSTNASYIPYRQSIITLMLQDSLNTKNFISLIACVNSNPEDCNETVQTLEFAQRVKKMRNKPEVSEAVSQYKKDNPSLFQSSKLGSTPFKRPAPAYQTPYTVKKNKLPLKVINESVGYNTAIERPESLSSLNISSALSMADITQQNLSPIIKKHINAMESNLMNKLESIIINTLKIPTRSSLSKEDKNKENTPKLSWNNIQNEVSKLVRQEIVQLTAKATRAASSPIEDHPHFTKIKRILKYDSPVLNERQENNKVQNTCTPSEISSIDVEFKIPDLPISKPKSRKAKRTSFISPINFVPRKSLRLSLKKRNSSFEDSDISLESSYIQSKKRPKT